MSHYAARTSVFKWTISSVLTTVAQVVSIRRAGSTAVIDMTNLSSSALEKVADIVDEGQVTLELVLDPADSTHVALENDFQSGVTRQWRTIWSDVGLTQRTGNGFITNYEEGGRVRDGLRAMLTLEITGPVTTP